MFVSLNPIVRIVRVLVCSMHMVMDGCNETKCSQKLVPHAFDSLVLSLNAYHACYCCCMNGVVT